MPKQDYFGHMSVHQIRIVKADTARIKLKKIMGLEAWVRVKFFVAVRSGRTCWKADTSACANDPDASWPKERVSAIRCAHTGSRMQWWTAASGSMARTTS